MLWVTAITGTPGMEQQFTCDQLGNWTDYVQQAAGTTTLDQQRTHNSANEIDVDNDHTNAPGASIATTTGTNWADPKYDANGNLI